MRIFFVFFLSIDFKVEAGLSAGRDGDADLFY